MKCPRAKRVEIEPNEELPYKGIYQNVRNTSFMHISELWMSVKSIKILLADKLSQEKYSPINFSFSMQSSVDQMIFISAQTSHSSK